MDRQSRFVLMVAVEIPAIILSFLIFVYFAFNRPVCSKLKNHGWLILLIVNFCQLLFNLPMPMSYNYLNYIWPPVSAYCIWWTWCEYSLYSVGLFLMAWISIERHLLVFHAHTMLQGRWKKCVFHVLPITFCLIWPPLFFFIFVVISPFCTTSWDYSLFLCGFPCYYGEKVLSQFDFIFHIFVPVLMIMIANITLVARVIYQKMSRQHPANWRRHVRMVLQLWVISSLYMGFWFPVTITIFIQTVSDSSFMADHLEKMQFAVYFVPLLLPAICLVALPELVSKIKSMITIRRVNAISVVATR